MTLDHAMQRIGRNVKRLRKDKKITQERMRDFGFNYRYFQKVEAGKVNVTLDTLVKLANTLRCSLSDLVQ